MVDALGAEAIEWLSTLAERLALPAAIFGAVFIPSPNDGTSEQGPVPDRPGMSYGLDRDTGTLRLSLDSDPDPDNALVARLGRKLFDILYEQFVRDHVNPQRKPQLPPGIAFALPADTKSGWVHYDDCREATGGMIEAKGNYAEMLSSFHGRFWLEEDWIEQAEVQIRGAKGRTIDWYFNDQAAADFAHLAFKDAEIDNRIGIHVLPYPGGVPKYNPRVR